ncbi:hypothetical protein ADEAN_000321400 [Angomonas deanei]|uniref:Uncharacterized protein n=1 Tax=Angomonas deanei TaxID=59799 RepID=A0A7G2C7N7_9TRYP|nr:hypothetical protein ADEAN_000321400 [Angomonas deanei]
MAVVHSILPRPFAYRRTKMMADSLVQQKQKQNHQAMKSGVDVDKEEGADGVTARSTKAILFSREIQYERKVVEEMLNTQLRRMERAEAAAMLAEDAFVLHEKKGSGTAPPTSDAPGEEEGTLLTLTESPTNPFAELKNPYMFTTQLEEFYKKTANYSDSDSDSDGEKLAEDTQANKVRKTLCFMYCDVVGSASLVRELRNFMKDIREKRKAAHSLNDSLAGSDEEEEEDEDFITTRILTSVYEHYNYIAQSILHRHNGYVCATHGGTGYAVAFRSCKDALEAASNLLQAVNSESWPRCLRSLESSLYVKEILKQRLPQSDGAEGHRVDQKTGEHYTVLFNGPRPQISVHRSNQYTWNVIPPVKPKRAKRRPNHPSWPTRRYTSLARRWRRCTF